MNHQVRKTLTALALLASAWPLAAQTNPTAPVKPDEENKEAVIVLTPFEVSADSDSGYQATATLAGTRIRTDLKDVGSAISVATKEFMSDIGATNSQTLLQYMTSTEVGGAGGNFGGLGDTGALDDANARLNPNNNTRVRGLASADNTRDFFLTDIPWDGYNSSRIDLQRGANSILFGNGSGAGILNADIDSAIIGRNKIVVEARYGSYGSNRASLDINRTLLPKQLAVKFSALYDKDYYRQKPAFNTDKRYFGAVTFEPEFLKHGSARTRVEVSYEHGDINANRPRTTPPIDEITPWFITTPREMRSPTSLGRPAGTDDTLLGVINPMISHAGYDPFVVGVSNNTLNSANPGRKDIGAGVNGNTNSEPWITFGSNNGVNGDWQGGFGAIFGDAGSGTLNNYLMTGNNLYYAIGSNGQRDGTIAGLRGQTYNGILSFSDYAQARNFVYQSNGVYRQTTISDPSIFDFYNKLLDGPNKGEFSRFQAYNINVTQTFLNDKIGFQFTHDRQVYRYGQHSNLGGQPILGMDIFSFLPVAKPDANGLLQPVQNPNFGRPWTVSGRGSWSNEKRDRKTSRFTPYADIDFKTILKSDDILTKILGRHQITGLIEQNEVNYEGANGPTNTLGYDQAAAIIGPGGAIGDVNRKITIVSYLGASVAGNSTLVGANIPNITAVQSPGIGAGVRFIPSYLGTAPSPGTAYVIPKLGLSPSQASSSLTATVASTASENPANYVGWTGTTDINVNNVTATGVYIATSASQTKDVTRSEAIVDQWALFDRKIVFTGGLRNDEIKTYLPENPNDVPGVGSGNRLNGSGSYGTVDYSAKFNMPTAPTRTFKSDTLKTWSVVGHTPEFINKHLPWGLRGSVFLANSENFQPKNLIDVYGNALPPPSGTTREYGILIEAFEGKVALKINKYKTQFKGAVLVDNGNGLRSRIGDELQQGMRFALATKTHSALAGYRQNDPFDPTGLYAWTPTKHVNPSTGEIDAGAIPITSANGAATQADWAATERRAQLVADDYLAHTLNETAILNAYAIFPSQYDPVTNINLSRATPAGLEVTSDTLSKGTEIELFLRPTTNWNLTVNAAKVFATRTNLAGAAVDWMTRRSALYFGGSPLGELPWFGAGQAQTDNAGRLNTAGLARFGRNAWAFYNLFRTQEGNATPEMREWRVNTVTRYSFSHGFLKGSFVGGGYRYEGKQIIGYGLTEVTPAFGSNAAIAKLDPAKPYYGPKEDAIDLFIGYSRKISHDINWRIQLNVRDAFGNPHLIPVNTNPDGSIASYRIDSGRTWELSNHFEF